METQLASFQLLTFVIPEFSFNEAEEKFSIVEIHLIPTGLYNTSNGEYNIFLSFIAEAKNEKNTEEKKTVLSGTLKALFKIDNNPTENEIPDFFYQNGLAIVFPYLRAFVSNITLQAGSRVLILPLLNLTSLASSLKENTKVFK